MKVISFSLWGNDPKYCVGAIKNAKLAMGIYPGWTCRFHIANTLVNYPTVVDELKRLPNVEVVYLDNYRADWGLMLSRLNPLADPNVEVMISRDCDSRLSIREKLAVDEWIESDKTFHTMHDHPYHTVPILGGMFGMKGRNVLALDMVHWAHEWYLNNTERWQVDQDFLTKQVWPLVQNDVMNHDQFYTHLWGGIPFPTRRVGNEFVGQVFDEKELTVQEHVMALNRYLKFYGEQIR